MSDEEGEYAIWNYPEEEEAFNAVYELWEIDHNIGLTFLNKMLCIFLENMNAGGLEAYFQKRSDSRLYKTVVTSRRVNDD